MAATTSVCDVYTVYWGSFTEIKFREFRKVDSICETLIREC